MGYTIDGKWLLWLLIFQVVLPSSSRVKGLADFCSGDVKKSKILLKYNGTMGHRHCTCDVSVKNAIVGGTYQIRSVKVRNDAQRRGGFYVLTFRSDRPNAPKTIINENKENNTILFEANQTDKVRLDLQFRQKDTAKLPRVFSIKIEKENVQGKFVVHCYAMERGHLDEPVSDTYPVVYIAIGASGCLIQVEIIIIILLCWRHKRRNFKVSPRATYSGFGDDSVGHIYDEIQII